MKLEFADHLRISMFQNVDSLLAVTSSPPSSDSMCVSNKHIIKCGAAVDTRNQIRGSRCQVVEEHARTCPYGSRWRMLGYFYFKRFTTSITRSPALLCFTFTGYNVCGTGVMKFSTIASHQEKLAKSF